MEKSYRTQTAALNAGVAAARRYARSVDRLAAVFVYCDGFRPPLYCYDVEDLGHGGIGEPQAVVYPDGRIDF